MNLPIELHPLRLETSSKGAYVNPNFRKRVTRQRRELSRLQKYRRHKIVLEVIKRESILLARIAKAAHDNDFIDEHMCELAVQAIRRINYHKNKFLEAINELC